jgi:pimeloyl-ACP methyl ester carboxylesterase
MTTYHYAQVRGRKLFYREAGSKGLPTIVLLHGFPSSSHMFRDLIPQLEDKLHVIAPDYVGFGYSDAPSANEFQYTFDNLAAHVEELLFKNLGLKQFSIYVQDYGAPVGYRIAAQHPDAIQSIVVQNGNAYAEGIGSGFDAMKPFWANRNSETEKPVRELLKKETTLFQYTHGVKDAERISPDSYTLDQFLLDRPGPVMTERRRTFMEKWAPAHNMSVEEAMKRFPEEVGISRYGQPDEIAELLAFMVSPAAKWMTGTSVRMDGGEIKGI